MFCRQRSDERLKRGGEQKSVVVLATQPYSSVLGPLSQHAGPVYFNRGASALQHVWDSSLSAGKGLRLMCLMHLLFHKEASGCHPPAAVQHGLHPLVTA